MNSVETFSVLDVNFLSTIMPAILSLIAFTFKWLKKLPDNDDGYFSKAGVSPYELKLSMTKFDFWKTKPLKKSSKVCYGLIIIFLVSCITTFLYLGGETIKNQPNGWAALVLIKTKENFLLSYDEAKSFPGEKSWALTYEDCYRDTYESIRRNKGISLDLALSICSRIGLKGEVAGIKKRISATQKDKRTSFSLCAFIIAFFSYFLISALIDLNIRSKILRYMKS